MVQDGLVAPGSVKVEIIVADHANGAGTVRSSLKFKDQLIRGSQGVNYGGIDGRWEALHP